jgi:exopolyphosphatase / guanosine-5'-triphosphate,3'-diphosphate pyrophosphatase
MLATMGEIVPRWEWRTFGERFEPADERFAALEPERVQESDELYLLSVGSTQSTVKVRDELMDVKRLEHVNDDGLQQWLPVMKAGFPLGAADVASVLKALGVDPPELERAEYSLDQLLAEVVEPNPALLPVDVHKVRHRYTIGGCMTEHTDVVTDRGSTRTIAIETTDPALVSDTVRDLGLASLPNTSFPRGLRRLVGFGVGRYAVLDVGTNSVKFHIGEKHADDSWTTIVDRAEVTRLGEGLAEAGKLTPEAIARTVDAIAGMVDEARRNEVLAISIVGTAGLRIAPNASELIDAVRARSGVTVEVIPGDEEARLAYLAARAGLGPVSGAVVVFDTGGGSSQFTFGRGDAVLERFSVDVGAARFTEQFGLDGAVSDETLARAREAIASELGRLDGRPAPDALVGMGGAVTNLAAVKHELATYDPDVVQGTVLDRSEIDRQIELYRSRDAAARREIVGLQPGRAEVILAGACIVRTVLAKLQTESFTVSDRGLRHGRLAELYS